MKLNEDKIYGVVTKIILWIASLTSLVPFILLVSASFTDEDAIILNGYSLLPSVFSVNAYEYLFNKFDQIGRAYFVTIFVTVVGTAACLIITSAISYTLSRKDLPFRKPLMFFVFFTLLFNGGLVPTYLMYTQGFHLKNTIFALLIPMLLTNAYFILLMRTFFVVNIPFSLIEAAMIDGAGELKIYLDIVMPLSKPILATIGLFAGMAYWNDWFNGLIYLTEPKLFSIQNVLNKIITDAQFLSNNASIASAAAESASKIPTYGVRMAMAVVGVLPIIIVYAFAQKYFVKGIALGGVKG